MPKYYIWTIGCQMNKAESERLAGLFAELGYLPTDTAEDADIVLLNSCVVRQSAENRAANKIHALKKLKKAYPEKTLAVTGCLVNSDTATLKKRFPQVDFFFAAGERPPWLREKALPVPAIHSPSTYVPIMQGCNNFCTYCIVPYRRGREKSRLVEDVSCEVRELVKRGTREVVLLGQNVNSYGHGLPGNPDLAGLLAELDSIEGLLRIRFLTNHPRDMSGSLVEAIARLEKVCEQVNLPVQSGSNEILKAMGRGYSVEQYRELVAAMRERVPGIALSTDVIVGFPGETDRQFGETYDLLSGLRFDTVHVAAYSPREGTAAARELEDDVPQEEKKDRLSQVERLQEKIAAEINGQLMNQTLEVLVEGRSKGKWYGRTRTDKPVFFSAAGDFTGKLVHLRISRTSAWSLQGSVIKDWEEKTGCEK